MSEKNMIIRLGTKDDYRAVENLIRESFCNVYQPGCMEYYVLHCYRDAPAFVPELDFVMELGGEMIGQIIYAHCSFFIEYRILMMRAAVSRPLLENYGFQRTSSLYI